MNLNFLLCWGAVALVIGLFVQALLPPGAPVFAAPIAGILFGLYATRRVFHSREREDAVRRARAHLYEEQELAKLRGQHNP